MLRNSVLCNFAPAWPVGLDLVLLLLKPLAEIPLVPVVSRQNWGEVFSVRLHVSLAASLHMFSIVISIYLNIRNYLQVSTPVLKQHLRDKNESLNLQKKKKRAHVFGYYVEKLDYVCGNFVRSLLSDECVYYFDLIATL